MYSRGRRSVRQALSMMLSVILTLTSLYTGGVTAYAAETEEMVTFTRAYDFRDHSVVPEGQEGSTVTSPDGRITVAGDYKYNGSQHGIQFNEAAITIKVKKGSGKVVVAGCYYCDDGQVSLAKKGETGTPQNTKVTTCFSASTDVSLADGTNSVSFDYTAAEDAEYVLSFTGANNYTPIIWVTGTEPKEQEEQKDPEDSKDPEEEETVDTSDMIDFTRAYDFRDHSVVPSGKEGSAVTSSDGRITVAGDYKYNGSQHGIQFNEAAITIKVEKGKGKVVVAGCVYCDDGQVSLAKKGETGTPQNTKVTACFPASTDVSQTNAANSVSFDYTAPEAAEYVLSFTGVNNYIPIIWVTGKEPKPATVSVAVTLKDEKKVLQSGYSVSLQADTGAVTITADGAQELAIGSSYTAVVKDENGAAAEGLAAKINGADSVEIQKETQEITITLDTTVVSVTPTITGADADSVKVIAKADKNAYELKNGVVIKLPKNTKYTLEVQDADGKKLADWTAKAGGKTSFETADEETMTLTIEAKEVKEVDITPVISDQGSLLGSCVIWAVNQKDAEDAVRLAAGEAVGLKTNTTYDIALKSADGAAVTDLEATVDGKTSFTTGVEAKEVVFAISMAPTRTVKYGTFTKANSKDGKGTQTLGEVLYGTNEVTSGILYVEKGTSSGCSYDNQLRFRAGVVLYLPIQDDTTKVTYIQTSNANQKARCTHFGYRDSGYKIDMRSGDAAITIDDITDLIQEKDGQKYLPIVSDGDVKLNEITLIEYNPVNTVKVTGTVVNAAECGITAIHFKNMKEGMEELPVVTADVAADGTYRVELRRSGGYTQYAASVSATGYKVEDQEDADKLTLIGNGQTATCDFTVVKAPTAELSGKFTGVPDAAVKGKLQVSLIPDNKAISPIEIMMEKTADGVYTYQGLTVDIGREYTVELTGADDYEVLGTLLQAAGDPAVRDFAATAKPVYTVSGKFVTSDKKTAAVTSITFTNMNDKQYSYTFEVSGDSYSAALREAEYETKVVCEGYTAYDHVSVKKEAVSNDVYLQGAADTSSVKYQAQVEVGAGKQFEKIADAVDYISRMDRKDTDRVTIVLTADEVYREQLVIDTPNITIKGNGAKITWYYGVGFSYYSAKLSADGKSAYYDEAYAVDRYKKQEISQNPGHWGATVNLLSGAAGFAAENVIFENSLNRYLTTEELWDGAAKNVTASITDRSTENIDVKTNAAKERACAIYIQADNTEYKDCQFLSRQDTVYTGDADENSYFVNCVLEGNVDYLCGDGNPVFDRCVLSVYGYPGSSYAGSIIVANKAKATHGYLFDNCKIVSSTYGDVGETTANVLARAWDAGKITWLNTEVENAKSIAAGKPYLDMNAKAKDATYLEYNTHTPDGTPIDTSKREAGYGGTVLTAEQAAKIRMTDYFDDWAPMYYEGELAVEVKDLVMVGVAAPELEEKPGYAFELENPGVIAGSLTWYVDGSETAFLGEQFEAGTVYKAVAQVSLEERYLFAKEVSVSVEGALDAKVQVSADRKSAVITVTYPRCALKKWKFAAFGTGVDKNAALAKGSVNNNTLHVEATGGKGKLQPSSTDGLAFYYTQIDPATENFILSADITIPAGGWTYSNGQEGFGLMAADAVGEHGSSAIFWNNSYMAQVTKVEYLWDASKQEVAPGGVKYSMKLGVGAQEKIGVTTENLDALKSGKLDGYQASQKTLETYCAQKGLPAGTYNRVGNYTNASMDGNQNLQTTFHLTIQRNNTGYLVSYTDENGKTTTEKYYHGDDGDELTKLDPDHIYIGFFAARNVKMDVKNVELTLIDPKEDAPAEERPTTKVPVSAKFESASVANSDKYELIYIGNADGTLEVKQDGKVIVDALAVQANTKYRFDTALAAANNLFEGTFTPKEGYRPSEHEKLEDYSPKTFSITVKKNTSDRNIYYVAPGENGDGSKANPANIYRIINLVKPGDVILLKEGTYLCSQTITVERGIDGTADKRIYMMADPEAKSRPILDFGGDCAGMVLAGDYWYFQGFDVTRSANGQKGIQVSGCHNVLDRINAYRNGNTGIQISRYLSTDLWEDWPADNLILNCTSYLNADLGYEDADGFSAKLTVGSGNRFDGCIAAYNADDGWDLFAKVETGKIGSVTIENCVTFKNGYVIDENGKEKVAGNGNGFKMGGSSISGYHVLKNSVAFGNRAKGIDSNSCPDIQVYNSTSYDNETYNVALYTNDAKNTDFLAQGILSYRSEASAGKMAENLKLLGTQDRSKVENDSNYFFDGTQSTNGAATVSDDWFVSLDMDAAIHGGITRNANGTINMNGFLEIDPKGGSTTVVGFVSGSRFLGAGTASEVIALPAYVGPSENKPSENKPSESPKPNPSASQSAQETPAPAPVAVTYIVVRGDTLSAIAARNHMSLAALIALNPQIKNPNLIYPGQVICLGYSGAETAGTTVETSGDHVVMAAYDIVKKGDSLYAIARRNRMTLLQIVQLNPALARQRYIYAGQKVRIK